MPSKTRPEIEKIARKLLKENDMYKLPLDSVLANKIGAKVANPEFIDMSISGMITVNSETAQILVNMLDPPHRKIFTIAHELGHKVLHLESGCNYVDSQINMFRRNLDVDCEEQRKEVEATQFAAALLMGENFVREIWQTVTSVYRMADLFSSVTICNGIQV